MNVRASTGSSAAPPTTARRSRPPSRARIGFATMRAQQRQRERVEPSLPAAARRDSRAPRTRRTASACTGDARERLRRCARGSARRSAARRTSPSAPASTRSSAICATPRAIDDLGADRTAAGSSRRCARTCATAAGSTGTCRRRRAMPRVAAGARRWRGCCRATASRPSAAPRCRTCSRSSRACRRRQFREAAAPQPSRGRRLATVGTVVAGVGRSTITTGGKARLRSRRTPAPCARAFDDQQHAPRRWRRTRRRCPALSST